MIGIMLGRIAGEGYEAGGCEKRISGVWGFVGEDVVFDCIGVPVFECAHSSFTSREYSWTSLAKRFLGNTLRPRCCKALYLIKLSRILFPYTPTPLHSLSSIMLLAQYICYLLVKYIS